MINLTLLPLTDKSITPGRDGTYGLQLASHCDSRAPSGKRYVLCELLLLPTRVALWSTPAGPVSTPAHVSLHVRKQFVQIRRWRP